MPKDIICEGFYIEVRIKEENHKYTSHCHVHFKDGSSLWASLTMNNTKTIRVSGKVKGGEHYMRSVMEESDYKIPGYGIAKVDKKTKKQLSKTENEPSDVNFNPDSSKVRISILMEGDLLSALKSEAKNRGVPYQTLMKEMLRKQTNLS